MREDVIQESKESVFRPPLAYVKDASTKPWKIVVSASLALISALTLFSNVTMDGTTAYHALRAVFPMHPGIGASAFLLFFAYLFAFLNLRKLDALNTCLSLCFALSVIFGRSLNTYGDLSFVTTGAFYPAVSLFCLIGYAGIFYLIVGLFSAFIDYYADKPRSTSSEAPIKPLKTFGIALGVILLCWLPYIIVMFPGQTSSDFIAELRQYFGAIEAYDHHPWFMTLLFGTLHRIGMFFTGSSTGGIFTISAIQTLAMAASFAFFIVILKKLGCPKCIRIGIVVFFALCPIFPTFAQWRVKNSLAAVFLVHFIVQLTFKLFASDKLASGALSKYISWPAIAISAVLSALSRHDSIYIVIAFLLVALILLKRKNRAACVAVATITAAAFYAWGSILVPSLGILPGDVREALSIPLMQTTRVVDLYSDDLAEEEIAALQNPCDIPISELPDYYSIAVSDNIKNHYTFEDGELPVYAQTYLALGMKHPDVYVQVFLAHSFGYWYTNASDTFTASEATISSEDMIHPSFFAKSAEDRVDLSDKVYNLKAAFPDGRYIAEKLTQLTSNLPITSLLYTPASYFWMGIILTLLLTRKDCRYLVMLVPIAMLFLICCASPLNGSVRYALPIVFLTPVLFGWATTPNVVDQQTPFKSENKVKGIPPC